MQMGAGVLLDPKTVRDFKKDLKENLEREMREKANVNNGLEKRTVNATPHAATSGADMFDLYATWCISWRAKTDYNQTHFQHAQIPRQRLCD
jgi:hypothetical protein